MGSCPMDDFALSHFEHAATDIKQVFFKIFLHDPWCLQSHPVWRDAYIKVLTTAAGMGF